MKIKFVAIILAIFMIVVSVPFSAVFAEESDGFVYVIENDEVTITDYNGEPDGTITIPDKIDGKPVTVLGDSALRNHKNLTGAVLPATLKKIDICAFADSKITRLHLPASVEEIGSSAFYSCPELRTITVDGNSKSFTADENGVLYNKEKTKLIRYPQGLDLKEYTMPDSVLTIAVGAFEGNVELEKVKFNSGLKVIENQAFISCKKLDNIELPSQLESIGQLSFYETAHFLDESKWESGALYIGKYLICTDRTLSGTYEIKDGTSLLAYGAMGSNTDLKEVVIPDSLKIISQAAFENNAKLEKIEIPDSVKKIESHAFRNCSALKKIRIPSGIEAIEKETFDGCVWLEEVVLPAGLTTIGTHAFGICRALEKITLPDSVTTIEMYAFSSCSNLREINIPAGVTYIGEKAFNDTAITKIDLPKGVTKIEPAVFSQCKNLEEITFHNTLTQVSGFAFDGCKNLKKINYTGTQEEWGAIAISEECNESFINATVNYDYVARGDVDMNGKINSSDALLVLQSATGLTTLSEKQLKAAELTNDEKITSSDALAILQFATGLIKVI